MLTHTKTDNHNPAAKLALRRHFLDRFHAQGRREVLDCCMGDGFLWAELRRTYDCTYLGLDVKKARGRLKLDSIKFLAAGGWPQNIIDVDTYGQPWPHWAQILRHARGPAITVFLTAGMINKGLGNGSHADQAILGCRFQRPFPNSLAALCNRIAPDYHLASARDHGWQIVALVEADNPTQHNGGATRYLGVHLVKIADNSRANSRKKSRPLESSAKTAAISPLVLSA